MAGPELIDLTFYSAACLEYIYVPAYSAISNVPGPLM